MFDLEAIEAAAQHLKVLNPRYQAKAPNQRAYALQKVLVANRGEIAKRFFHSLKEEGIPSVAIVTTPDRGQSWYATADEALFIGDPLNYMSIPTVIAAAVVAGANAIYPGYGFLSENDVFVDAIAAAARHFNRELIFMGPAASIMRAAKQLNTDDSFFGNAAHMEVQIFNGTAIGIRKCAVQRRNQKILEESGEVFLSPQLNLSIITAAEKMAQATGCEAGAGTVEFLYDYESGKLGFLGMHTQLQAGHPVIDLAQWQVLHFDGRTAEIPFEHALHQRLSSSHAIEARIYAEDPENNYHPASGTLLELNLPAFNAIRCDFGFSKGDSILPDFDPMLGKIIATGATRAEALAHLERALSEFYVKGVTTNIQQLLNIVRSPHFKEPNYTNNFLADHPELTEDSVTDAAALQAAVFAAVAIDLKKTSESARKLILARDIEDMLRSQDFNPSPEEYIAESGRHLFHLNLLPVSLDGVRVYANNIYYGDIEVLSRIPANDDFFIRFESRSYHVRIDLHPAYLIVRFPDHEGRVNYHRLKLHAEESKERSDPPGLVRAPFHGIFVRFCPDLVAGTGHLKTGSRVKKRQPLMIVEAMKMEVTLVAPIDGEITFLLEGVQLGYSSAAQFSDRRIEQGEILIQISSEAAGTEMQHGDEPQKDLVNLGNGTLENLLSYRLPGLVRENPTLHQPVLLQIVTSVFHGMIGNEKVISRLTVALENLARSDGNANAQLVEILERYSAIKSTFSSFIFRDLHELFAYTGIRTVYHPSPAFRNLMNGLFHPYGVVDWLPGAGSDHGRVELALVRIFRSYYACKTFQPLMRIVLRMLAQTREPRASTIRAVRRIARLEEMEWDDSLADLATGMLGAWGVSTREDQPRWLVPRQYRSEYVRMRKDALAVFPDIVRDDALAKMSDSLKTPFSDLIPEDGPKWVHELLKERQAKLAEEFYLTRYYAPVPQLLFYGLQSRTDETDCRYLCVAINDEVNVERDARSEIAGSAELDRVMIDAAGLLTAYQGIEQRSRSWVETLAAGNVAGRSPQLLNQATLRSMMVRIFPFFSGSGLTKNILSLKAASGMLHLMVAQANGSVELSLLSENDPAYPYANKSSPDADRKLFARQKWPAEFWAQQCYDTQSMREVLIASIDSQIRRNPETGNDEKVPVGSRLFEGTIAGKKALFYIKDSRVQGGATGDLEGLKYVAACYLSFMLSAPLYVLNDGAGANIREGMISLNRAGEGFMMNSLVRADVSPQDFFSWIDSHSDDQLRALVLEVNTIFSLNKKAAAAGAFIVAVGIGSSTGLDVYGSSQAAIQCMTDSAESYRVLTGAKVVRSVTREKISNYDLGGARVMSMFTGTVDLVAAGNLQLLSLIRQIHEMFAPDEPRRSVVASASPDRQRVIVGGVDVAPYIDGGEFLEFKEKYYRAESLVGGFARFAGRKVLIMGPRDDFGMRTAPAVIKSYELLNTARKTGASQIFISGRNWYQNTSAEDSSMHRARLDFMRLLQEKTGVCIHIVTHSLALDQLPTGANADAVIVVLPEESDGKTRNYVHKAATHVVRTIADAFTAAENIMQLLKSREIAAAPNQGEVRIPENPAEPYDMIASVIEPVFDAGTFTEYFKPADNRMEGSTLITGLARLEGTTVAVIADQPAIIGGAPDAHGTEKFRIFTEFLNQNQIPLIMLSNAPGFIPGKKQERLRIQQIGGLSLDMNIRSKMPVVSVVLNQNFGGRQVQAFSKYLRPGIVYIALRKAVMAVMGAQSAFYLFEGDRYRQLLSQDSKVAEKFRDEYIREYNENAAAGADALATGILDWVFEEPATLRNELVRGLKMAEEQTRAWLEGSFWEAPKKAPNTW